MSVTFLQQAEFLTMSHTVGLSPSHELLEKVGMEILKAARPGQEIPLIACSHGYFHFDIENHLLYR